MPAVGLRCLDLPVSLARFFQPFRKQLFGPFELISATCPQIPTGPVDEEVEHPHSGSGPFRRDFLRSK
jgi:hypothetical protein